MSSSIAEHYGKKTGRGLIKIAQMAGIDDAEDCLRSTKQDQQQYETLIVEDDIEEGAVHVHATVVFQEAQLSELIHEETYP
jgi:hypothetical protein